MNEKTEIKVAIVEDHAALRSRLEVLLKQTAGFCCAGAFQNGEEALEKIPALAPQVVITDLNLPGISGVEVAARLKVLLPETNIMVLTVYSDSENIFNALQAGACGYLLKRATTKEILDAIHEVSTGGAPMSSEIARKVVMAFHSQKATAETKSVDSAYLSERETQILDLLCQGCANKEIAVQLFISADTVRFHLKKIYEKLHVRSRTEAMAKYGFSQNTSIEIQKKT